MDQPTNKDNVSGPHTLEIVPQDSSIWQKLLSWTMTTLAGGTAKVSFNVGVTLPKFQISETFRIFNTNETVSIGADGSDANLTLKSSPAQ